MTNPNKATVSVVMYTTSHGTWDIYDGTPIPVKRVGGRLADEFVDQLPDIAIVTVGTKLINRSSLTPEQTGE